MAITQRDVRGLDEQQDYAQQVAKQMEALRWRDGVTDATRERAKEASEAWGEAAAKTRALQGRIENDEEVRM